MPDTDVRREVYVPIYYGTPEEAYSHGYDSPDALAFRASLNAAVRCSRDLQRLADEKGYELALDPAPINGLIEKHGPEMVSFCLASAVHTYSQEFFSEDTREWSRNVRVSDSPAVTEASAPLITGGTADRIREAADEAMYTGPTEKAWEEYELAVEEYIEAWERSMKEDSDSFLKYSADETDKFAADEGLADDITGELTDDIIKDFPELAKSSPKGRTRDNGDGSITVDIPDTATVKRYSTGTLFSMPRGSAYERYIFYAADEDMNIHMDGTLSVTIRATLGEETRLTYLGEDMYVTLPRLKRAFDGAEDEDFSPVMFDVKIPKDAVEKEIGDRVRVRFPDNSRYAGSTTVISSEYEKDFLSEDGKRVFSVPGYVTFGVFCPDGHPRIPCEELAGIMSDAVYKKRVRYETLEISDAAVINTFDKQTYLRMPVGSYEGFAYYVPNGMIEKKDGKMIVRLPEDKVMTLKDVHGRKEEFTSLQLKNLVSGKESDAYRVKKHTEEKFLPGVSDGPAPEINGPDLTAEK
ncbi:MAG: DUF3849 domain-containing protein [Bacteroidales bacterium]|nr:DUF3849 domain-containing protein [Bacteroidales bacterium]